VLQYVGGAVSPEMQTPKLAWLKTHLPASWQRARRFLDLPDFLTYRATGEDVRSLCTTTCKWTYLEKGGGWDATFFQRAGLSDLASEGFSRIGTRVRPPGERIGTLTAEAARELGLTAGIPVGVSLIDAHAGGVGCLGVGLLGLDRGTAALESRVALIGGTSTCHMAVSQEPRFVPGVWGPYFAAMVPGLWLTEGGQSATGALIDHVVMSHARGPELRAQAEREKTTVYALLNARLDALAAAESSGGVSGRVPFPAALATDLHVLPDHHGNRSPRANPDALGMIAGLRLSDSIDALARLYLATVQALAHGTKHILDAMNANGHVVRAMVATGGDAKNPLFLREHADVTGYPILLPREGEAVLLGAAMLGAVAARAQPSLVEAMASMNAIARTIEPAGGAVAAFHGRKHEVFLRMYEDQQRYRAIMNEGR
jgi:FGGY-family pentulose kinase